MSQDPTNAITDEERRLIDAFPEHRIQKIPTGQSGQFTWPCKWDGKKLINVGEDGRRLTQSESIRHINGPKGRYSLAAIRRGEASRNRNAVVRAYESGLTTKSEIAAETGLSLSTVTKHMRGIRNTK